MKHKILRYALLALVIFILVFLYGWATRFGQGLNLLGKAPDWWLAELESLHRLVSWRHINGNIGLFIMTLPFALGIVLLVKRWPVRFALLVTTVHIVGGPILYLPLQFDWPMWEAYASWMLDVLTQMGFLPLTTWALSRLLATLRSKPDSSISAS